MNSSAAERSLAAASESGSGNGSSGGIGRARTSSISSFEIRSTVAISLARLTRGLRWMYGPVLMTWSRVGKTVSVSEMGGLSYSPSAHSGLSSWTCSSTWKRKRMIPGLSEGRPLSSFGRRVGRFRRSQSSGGRWKVGAGCFGLPLRLMRVAWSRANVSRTWRSVRT